MSLIMACSTKYYINLQQKTDLSFLNKKQKTDLKRVLGLSDFIADALLKEERLLGSIIESGLLDNAHRKEHIQTELERLLKTVIDEMQLYQVLRQFRRKHMLIIAWRDLLRKSSLTESFIHLSYLAEQILEQSLHWLYSKMCRDLGVPRNESGERQYLYIFVMGKLGGRELNFSSDIDLIFCYPERGETTGARRSIDNQPFFIKLGQRLIGALHQVTVDGFVYRVDMRLRPFGDAGPLVINFLSVEDYYQSHGREWERYAMVKARIIGEPGHYKEELKSMLKPFVYRRYIDFSAIESLRKMKAMIVAEVRRKNLKDNIKLGMGGIREIEFVAQSFQLIRGGRVRELQCHGLQETLSVLVKIGELPAQRAQRLLDAYQFLRRVENILQEIGDQQTQTLPKSELDRCRLIKVLDFAHWHLFYAHLQKVMCTVHEEFNWVVGGSDEDKKTEAEELIELWAHPLDQAEMCSILVEKGIDLGLVEKMAEQLLIFKKEVDKRPIGPRGQITIEKLLPKIVTKVCTYKHAIELMQRIRHLLLKIMCRTAYLELLNENEGALNQLLTLCHASPRVSEQLACYPILLDELLDPQHLYNPTSLIHYKRDLRQFMLRIPVEDMEQQMEGLRQFKQMQFLYIAAADIVGALELPKVSDHLTALSEALMAYVVHLAWMQMVSKYGIPSNVAGTDRKGFTVIGYGKMGGLELGYSSDLDVVFLHDSERQGHTNGTRIINNQLFYVRLAQRIIHLFNTRTNSGILYEIDIRLRPSGDAGLLVCSMQGYQQYLLNSAWTWEHQALVRSRAVFGDTQIVEMFNQVRAEVLALPRDVAKLGLEVLSMRQKMRAHLDRAKTGEFDLKQSKGGMVDIEFIAQYLVLANAHKTGYSLVQYSDNLRIFEACEASNILSKEQAHVLSHAYCHLRDSAHRLTLYKQTRIVACSLFKKEADAVLKIWDLFLSANAIKG